MKGIKCSFMLLAMSLLLIVSGCNNKSNNNSETKQQPLQPAKSFTPPDIPSMIMDQALKIEYLVTHYWDNFDFADSTFLSKPDDIEQAFVDYIILFEHTTAEATAKSIVKLIDKANANQSVYNWFAEKLDNYLYHANSPFRNDEHYAIVLEAILNNINIDDIYKSRPTHQLELINRNRLGKVAKDFTYTTIGNKTGTLHNVKAEYTLLFFYDPECPDCNRTRELLVNTPLIGKMVDSKKLAIMAIYPDDDIDAWQAYSPSFPNTWLNVYDNTPDKDIKNKLYSVRATPMLYLLDSSKRVILLDAMVEEVINFEY